LAAGEYTGTITVTAPGAGNSPQTVNVRLVVAAAPTPVVGRVSNAASFIIGPVAPGEIITIEGMNLGPGTPAFGAVANNMLATVASDVRVLFDGLPAPVLYVAATQVNTIVPYQVAGRTMTRIVVEHRGVVSAAVEVRVVDSAPGIFTLNGSGSGPGAILNQDNTVNTANTPAPRGGVIVIYATGEGATFPTGVNGRITTDPAENLRRPLLPVAVTIGGLNAEVLYAGAAPGFVAGALQINARLPAALAAGVHPVVVTVGSAASQPNVTVAVAGQ
jgi:uncharacterized protein (TIGR03437 family)